MSLLGASLASAVYLGFAPRVNDPLYRNLLFFPTRFPRDHTGVPALEEISGEDIYFKGDMGQRLNAWYWRRPDSKFVVIFNHGNSGNITIRENLSRLMLRSNCSVFVYDYQGFGRSDGRPSVKGICSDGRAAFDHLVNEMGFAPENILLYGESLGASVACHVSTQRTPAGLVLQSGFASLRRISLEHYPFLHIYPPALFPKPALDNISIVRKLEVPLLLIHGELDRVIPVKHSIDMYEAAACRKHFLRLPATAHADIFSTASEDYVRTLTEFFNTSNANHS